MKKQYTLASSPIIFRIISKDKIKQILISLAKKMGIDLMSLALQSIGVTKYWNPQASGEEYVLTKIIPKLLDTTHGRNPVLVDVGANLGNYSLQLAQLYPKASIYAFEPNPSTYKNLIKHLAPYNNIKAFNFGLGSQKGTLNFYTYGHDLESEHASVFKKVLTDLHHSEDINEMPVPIDTLSNFCQENQIDKIDFLKIDTEGFEYEVLMGAKELIKNKRIEVIQFEFNEMNVISRVFLKDFYEALPEYNFYRIDSNQLISLKEYNPINEIFLFQNILLIKKEINFNG